MDEEVGQLYHERVCVYGCSGESRSVVWDEEKNEQIR